MPAAIKAAPAWKLVGGAVAVIVVAFYLLVSTIGGVVGGMFGQDTQLEYGPSGQAVAGIPQEMLRLYQAAGTQYHIDWAIIAGIYKVESDHDRSTAQGVHSGMNAYGCCAGPGQFSVVGHPSTWDMYGQGGSVYDPKDAVPATARYLVAGGAPGNYHDAIWSYNHAEWYVTQVLQWATLYRGALKEVAGGGIDPGGDVPSDRHMTPKTLIDQLVLPMARAAGIQVTPQSVEAANAAHSVLTTSGNVSDHKGPPEHAWAADMSDNWLATNGSPNMTRLATALARRFKVTGWTGRGLVSVDRERVGACWFRFQLIYLTTEGGNHYNHVHFGVRALGC